IWVLVARRIARELPALAIEHVSQEAKDVDAAVDDRAVAALVKELDGPRAERAAEVLVRLHERGRVDAAPALARVTTRRGGALLWRSLIAVLDGRAEAHGFEIAAAAATAPPRELELAVRAIGLAGGVPDDATLRWRDHADAAVAITAEVARLRLEARGEELLDELCVEIAVGLAADARDRALGAARHLTRALRRGRGDRASRLAGYAALGRVVDEVREIRSAELSLLRADLLELARERVEQGASQIAPPEALTSLMRSDATTDVAPETAAALRLYGALLAGADAIDPEDLRRVAHALGEPDDEVRDAAETALAALGPAAAGELIATAAWGRRRARDRAAALLHDLPVTPASLDRLVDAELDALEQTNAALAIMTEPGDELIARRLDERLHEIAHTVLLLVAARRRSRAIQRAAIAWRHARGAQERARTLAVIEAALPRALVHRLVEAVDALSPRERASALQAAGGELPAREAVIRAELAGRDRLARALVLHALGASGRSAHREAITAAATAEVEQTGPVDLLRRLTQAIDHAPAVDDASSTNEGVPEMPSRVETLMALGRVPLLASLSTRQLADVAERARWSTAREGSVVVTAGDPIDALIVVDEGELQLGERVIGKGEVVDELACVAPVASATDLRARRASRLIRLERVDFEELVDDVPGLAAAVCRSLGERARRAEDQAYRSPLASKG
ncbi:MAG: cyclic nucleotide-binding domain-containing protein, partial [Proteobacteria bacterium]|nr:cyclic nucleotide-binding domain-containing protein [Pseudomonadota bacterium]